MTAPYLTILRPSQWLKNLMLFFPPFLGGQLLSLGHVAPGIVPFFAFCLVSSAGYLCNDILDRRRDACHPLKKKRPIPSGRVSVTGAGLLCACLLACGLTLGGLESRSFLALLSCYLIVTLLYSTWLKSYPVVDLFCISAGFLLRLQAGGVVFGITISPWLFLTVFLLSIFLSTGKRLCEYRLLGADATQHRKNLGAYPPGFLEGTMYMTGGAVLVTYAMYTVNRHTLVYSVPLCCFGLLRYILRIQSGHSGDPTESLLKDGVLFAVGTVWMVLVAWSIYW
ncbi:phosphoglycosyl-diphosphate--polyprenyl-phosphate phosphoglycosyltransferase, putative [Citrifermentans bemidjiense Bem]|uniref:Phosphoglycosyl-diphosphate--polyprenyl-phosphate phosphoglycosyltransferase, putative n=1 Tax=Citrifermentans bemidjiense (strain ATCC BAA-1014 / DSM 16622 / JCM 12645 / Bem) TaxID=404380 RepID=B5EGV9_CITBB|nr:decaprenyl-phosphate phosphoribosyltransferase [Citrifermentans bemidjiense]ACH39592.1 phosphoglycosyl-diphosphate--polyprenyl-phosphate phosphoglycosyltransferase, putative [Citrifermentans bemidjiense Bem]